MIFASLALSTIPGGAQTIVKGRGALVLQGRVAQLTIDLAGGSFTSFKLQGQDLSPLQWGSTSETPEPRAMGHFLCLDRWGAPSAAEVRNGMPFHGEAANVEWHVLQAPIERNGRILAEMSATLPLAGLKVRRHVGLSSGGAFFTVREEVTNANKLGRLYNMVQHATIGPPFLDTGTLVDSDARRGFMQNSPLPNPEDVAVTWPEALLHSRVVNMRRLVDDPDPDVVSYTVDEKYGWVTACNPARGLLIGYLWKSAEYPWFNAWRAVENGKPLARGLEFGTTGLHQPFPVLAAKGKIFGRPIYEYLDAGETRSKEFAGFLASVPRDYRGVEQVKYSAGRLVLHERESGPDRDITLEVGELFSTP